MKSNQVLSALVGLGLACATQANADIVFDFQQYGTGDQGTSKTFTTSGVSLTVSAFLTSGGGTDLWVKHDGGDENGLGTARDVDHEINATDFIQLTLPTVPKTSFNSIILGSTTGGEKAKIYWTTTAGTLTGATLLGTVNADGSFAIIDADKLATGFLDITVDSALANANVLLSSATFTAVPEPTTFVAGALLLLPFGASALRMVRKNKQA